MSASSEIIDKIKKLLRLARSSNPNEAALAMARAMELAAQHHVTIEGLNPDELAKEKAVTHRDTKELSRVTYDQRYAHAICRRFFRVTPVEAEVIHIVDGWPRSAWKTRLVGTASDIEIALYVFGFLTQHFAYCWRQFRGRLRNRHAYVYAMYLGIVSKLAEQMPETEVKGTELVLAEQTAYIAAVMGKLTSAPIGTPDSMASAAANAGWRQGRKTEIRTPLKPSAEPAPLALL